MREPRGLQIRSRARLLLFQPRETTLTAAAAETRTMGITRIISKRPYPPCRVALYPMHSSRRLPASSPNGALAGQAQIPTCCPVPSPSRLRQYKAVPVSLEKTNKTRRENPQTMDPRGKVHIKSREPDETWLSLGSCSHTVKCWHFDQETVLVDIQSHFLNTP